MTVDEPRRNQGPRFSAAAVIAVLVVGIILGGGFSFLALSGQINQMQQQIQSLQIQIQTQTPSSPSGVINSTNNNVSLSQLYQSIKDSVVVISGTVAQSSIFGTTYGEVQGSGFVYNLSGQMVVITNFHVVDGASNITVIFTNGNSYTIKVLGSDPYADLAVLSSNAPSNELKPLVVVSSVSLSVGDPVIAIGGPFGMAGSMTTGIVSQLGRTITEDTAGDYAIADVIQISAAINPGNSGGPLLNYLGQVVGITTATVSGSQGLGLAIPSSTILREVGPLATTGNYTTHSWLGISGTEMDYNIAKAMNVNVTYGWLIQSVVTGGPAAQAGLKGGNQQGIVAGSSIRLGGDIIIAMNGTKIINGDDLSSYLERNTLPGQTINITIVRGGQTVIVPVTLGTRPSPSS